MKKNVGEDGQGAVALIIRITVPEHGFSDLGLHPEIFEAHHFWLLEFGQ